MLPDRSGSRQALSGAHTPTNQALKLSAPGETRCRPLGQARPAPVRPRACVLALSTWPGWGPRRCCSEAPAGLPWGCRPPSCSPQLLHGVPSGSGPGKTVRMLSALGPRWLRRASPVCVPGASRGGSCCLCSAGGSVPAALLPPRDPRRPLELVMRGWRAAPAGSRGFLPLPEGREVGSRGRQSSCLLLRLRSRVLVLPASRTRWP